jgi:glycerol-1-phosphate dehydrogenase [NAD(P)+]
MRTVERLSVDEALRAARETRALLISENAIETTPRIFREQFGDLHAVIVADANTMKVAGESVARILQEARIPIIEPFVFRNDDLYAEYRFVAELEGSLRRHSAIPVAVGSGTINDLTKLAAHHTDRPYLCVATAASMDGYTAYGASITFEGSKQTFDCPAPTAVIADLKVIAEAPAAMNAWGYADLLAKVTAGADWILADALAVEPIDPLAWNIVQGGLREATADPAGVKRGEQIAIGNIINGLMLGGFAMQSTRSSRPASGAEHQFSHLWDMQHHTHAGSAPSHGLKVGIGTLAVTALYEHLLEMDLEDTDIDHSCAAWPGEDSWIGRAKELFRDDELRAVAAREIQAKYCSADELCRQLERLVASWPELRERLRAQLIPFAHLKAMLNTAGAATEPEQIGISRERLRDSFVQAFFIRRRFTVLDLAVRTQQIDSSLKALFGASGVWPIAT